MVQLLAACLTGNLLHDVTFNAIILGDDNAVVNQNRRMSSFKIAPAQNGRGYNGIYKTWVTEHTGPKAEKKKYNWVRYYTARTHRKSAGGFCMSTVVTFRAIVLSSASRYRSIKYSWQKRHAPFRRPSIVEAWEQEKKATSLYKVIAIINQSINQSIWQLNPFEI